jgi:hydrogenase maturation protease
VQTRSIATSRPAPLIHLEGDAIPAALAPKLSMHQVGLQELLAAGSSADALPERIVLLGLQPESVDWGVDLTPTIEAVLDGLVKSASSFISQSLELN